MSATETFFFLQHAHMLNITGWLLGVEVFKREGREQRSRAVLDNSQCLINSILRLAGS